MHMHRALLAVLASAAALVAVAPAFADCQPPASNGATVTCTGNDTTGVGNGTQNNVTVNVLSGASITLGIGAIDINLSNNSTITNNGTLVVGSGIGISAKNGSTITNNGTMTAGNASDGISAGGAASIVSNTGMIKVGDTSNGILTQGANSTILNTGTITAGAGSSGVLAFVGANTTVTNAGIITVGDNGTGIFSVGANGIVTNTGTITGGANAISASVGGNNSILFNSGVLDGMVVVNGTNTSLTNSGVITITNPGTAIGAVHTIVGTFTQTSAGTLALRANTALAHDTTTVVGTANLGGTLGAVLQPGLYGNTTTFAGVVTATNAITTKFGQAQAFAAGTTTPLAFFTVTPTYKANSVDITVNRLGFGTVAGESLNEQRVGNALDAAYTTTLTGAQATFFSNLLQATSVGALDQLSGEGTSGTQNTAFFAGNLFMQTMAQQADAWRSGDRADVPAGMPLQYAPDPNAKNPLYAADGKPPVYKAPSNVPTWHAWGAGFGGTQSLRGDSGVGSASLSDRAAGGALGFDYQAYPDLLLGLGVAGSTSRFSVADRATSGQLDGGHVGLYGMKTFGSAYLSALVSYGHFNNSTARTIAGIGPAETATGAFGSDRLGARLELGDTWMYRAVGVTPFAAIQASQLWQRGYAESSTVVGGGPGTLGLTYAPVTATSLPTFLGAQLDTRISLPTGTFFSPYLRAAWVHEFHPSRGITASFITVPGAAFAVDGARPATDSAKIDLGSQFMLGKNASFVAAFDGEFSGAGQSYGATGGFRMTW